MDLVNPPEDKWNTFIGKNVENSVKLNALKQISDYWLVPDPKAIHIIVELPRGKRWVQWVSGILLTVSRHPHLFSFHHPLNALRLTWHQHQDRTALVDLDDMTTEPRNALLFKELFVSPDGPIQILAT